MNTAARLVKNTSRYVYYRALQIFSLLDIFLNLRLAGAHNIVRLPVILTDGTKLEMTRAYYDYLVLSENLCSHVYEKHLPKDFSPRVILDLGAHKGFFSVVAAQHFPNATIYAVEASAENYKFLVANVAKFPKIHPIHAAIWNVRTTIQLHTGKQGGVSNSVFSRYGLADVENIRTITLEDLPKADFIKCDIEGSEHVLLFNAPYVSLEVHNDIEGLPGNVVENLEKSGYDIILEPPFVYAKLRPRNV